jgi:hypothetical protein
MVVIAKPDLASAGGEPLAEFQQLDSRAMIGSGDPHLFGDHPGAPVEREGFGFGIKGFDAAWKSAHG